MKKFRRLTDTLRTKKSSSQGSGGRGRTTKISTSSMNKNKRRLTKKKYRGQGRWFYPYSLAHYFWVSFFNWINYFHNFGGRHEHSINKGLQGRRRRIGDREKRWKKLEKSLTLSQILIYYNGESGLLYNFWLYAYNFWL